jgi:peroxiredoxin
LPSVNQLYGQFREKGLEVLLVNFRESPATVKRAVQERGYTAPVLLDESGDTTGRLYGVWGPPTVYLIDRRGQLVGRGAGPRDWESPKARQFIEALLAEKS